ncbi:unnamed protein product [Hapterophycus canaliculatus]
MLELNFLRLTLGLLSCHHRAGIHAQGGWRRPAGTRDVLAMTKMTATPSRVEDERQEGWLEAVDVPGRLAEAEEGDIATVGTDLPTSMTVRNTERATVRLRVQ